MMYYHRPVRVFRCPCCQEIVTHSDPTSEPGRVCGPHTELDGRAVMYWMEELVPKRDNDPDQGDVP